MDDKEKSVVARIIRMASDAVGILPKRRSRRPWTPTRKRWRRRPTSRPCYGETPPLLLSYPSSYSKKRAATKRANKRVAETARTVKAPA